MTLNDLFEYIVKLGATRDSEIQLSSIDITEKTVKVRMSDDDVPMLTADVQFSIKLENE